MLAICLTSLMLSLPVHAEDKAPTIKVDGQQITFDQQPQIVKGRMLIPIRAVMENLQANVNWNQQNKTVFITKDSVYMELRVGSSFAKVNGESKEFDVAATLVNGRTYVPLRFISESLGAKVTWSSKDHSVTIQTKPVGGKASYVILQDGSIGERFESFQRPEKLTDENEYVQFGYDRGKFHSTHFTSKQIEGQRYDVLVTTEGDYDFDNNLKGSMKIIITEPETQKIRFFTTRSFAAKIASFDTFPITAQQKLNEMVITIN